MRGVTYTKVVMAPHSIAAGKVETDMLSIVFRRVEHVDVGCDGRVDHALAGPVGVCVGDRPLAFDALHIFDLAHTRILPHGRTTSTAEHAAAPHVVLAALCILWWR